MKPALYKSLIVFFMTVLVTFPTNAGQEKKLAALLEEGSATEIKTFLNKSKNALNNPKFDPWDRIKYRLSDLEFSSNGLFYRGAKTTEENEKAIQKELEELIAIHKLVLPRLSLAQLKKLKGEPAPQHKAHLSMFLYNFCEPLFQQKLKGDVFIDTFIEHAGGKIWFDDADIPITFSTRYLAKAENSTAMEKCINRTAEVFMTKEQMKILNNPKKLNALTKRLMQDEKTK